MAWGQAGSTVYSILQNPSDAFLGLCCQTQKYFSGALRENSSRVRTLLKKTSREVTRESICDSDLNAHIASGGFVAADSAEHRVQTTSPAFAMLALAPDASSQFCVYHAAGPLSSAT